MLRVCWLGVVAWNLGSSVLAQTVPPIHVPAPPPIRETAPLIDSGLYTSSPVRESSGMRGGVSLPGPYAAFLRTEIGGVPTIASFTSDLEPRQRVQGQGTELGVWRNRIGVITPLSQDDLHELTLLANLDAVALPGEAILVNSKRTLPDSLWNLRIGAAYRTVLDNGWLAGGSVTFGTASDRPFYSNDEFIATLTGFVRIPRHDDNAWVLSVFYSPTSELRFPVPGIAYHWKRDETFEALVGIPFAVAWKPMDNVIASFNYLPVRNVHARVDYILAPPLRLYAAYDWDNESFFLAERADERSRLFYYEMRLGAGVQFYVSRMASLDLGAGYAFDRFFFQGRGFDDRERDRISLESGPFIAFKASVRW